MTAANNFLADLRKAGIIVRANGDRLVVEAPAGLVTTQLRDELARRKTTLLFALRDSTEPGLGPEDSENLHEVASLLAVAYQRFLRIPKVPVDQAFCATPAGVALSAGPSVHEGGRKDP